jgi:hypothetical protein
MKIELTLEEVNDIEEKAQKLINKVDSKEARSKETYADMKAIVSLLRRKKEQFYEGKLVKYEDRD